MTAGFNSSSRFYDTFRKVVGMTPQKYRKKTQAQLHRI
ncbi:AraC family transcriptional regulator [Pseudomonas bubulae]